jgi:hypothetical protein
MVSNISSILQDAQWNCNCDYNYNYELQPEHTGFREHRRFPAFIGDPCGGRTFSESRSIKYKIQIMYFACKKSSRDVFSTVVVCGPLLSYEGIT